MLGIAVAVAASLAVSVDARHAGLGPTLGDTFDLALFVGVCLLIAVLTVLFRDERHRADEARAETERALADARASAAQSERLLRIRDGFESMLAHEVRTPMTVIRGDSLLLRRESLAPELRAELVDDIVGESERLFQLIEDLLVLNRGDSMVDVSSEPISLPTLVRNVGGRLPGPAVRIAVTEPVPLVSGEPVLIEQVVRNLLSNARKYGGGGPIDVEVGPTVGGARVSVLDRGPGIEPGEEEHVFEPFVRSERDRDKPGAGIGLFVCRRLAEAMGGHVRATSRPGGGAALEVELRAFPQEG